MFEINALVFAQWLLNLCFYCIQDHRDSKNLNSMSCKCIACEFEVKNYNSLTRHLDKCLMTEEQKHQEISRVKNSLIENELHWLHQKLRKMQQILRKKETLNIMNEVIYNEALQFLSMKKAVNKTLNISSVKEKAVALETRSRVANYLHFSKTVVNHMQTSATSINCDFFNSKSQLIELQFFMFFLIVERYSEEKKIKKSVNIIIKKNDTFSWWKEISWWRDNVWVQKSESKKDYQNNKSMKSSERCVEQVQIIIIVLNHQRLNFKKWSQRYTETLFELKCWINREVTHSMHNMHEVKNFSLNTFQNSRLLNSCRFYDLLHIIHNAHLVSANQTRIRFYINNFIDWNQYNTVYDSNFMTSDKQIVDEWEKQKHQKKYKMCKKCKN